MAIVDNPEWLLSHVRHAFITSDDTGMCEICMQDNDLLPLNELRKRLKAKELAKKEKFAAKRELAKSAARKELAKKEKSAETNQPASTNTQPDKEDSLPTPPFFRPPSPDIQTGLVFSCRRRSNTAIRLDRIRKDRQSRIKVKHVQWKNDKQMSKEDLSELFTKKVVIKSGKSEPTPSANNSTAWDDLLITPSSLETKEDILDNELPSEEENAKPSCSKAAPKKQSYLSKQLQYVDPDLSNPFRNYKRLNAHGMHGGPREIKKFDMFFYPCGAKVPVGPLKIEILLLHNSSKVSDLVGLTCWQYKSENYTPELKHDSVQGYSVMIAEDNGEVELELPELLPDEQVSKFRFTTLALLEKRSADPKGDGESQILKTLFVKINHCDGTSLVQVDDLTITMGEIMEKALLKRKGASYIGNYKLEYQDRVGVAVRQEQTLDTTGAMEFYLLREHSSRASTTNKAIWDASSEPSEGEDDIMKSGIIFNK